MRSGTITVRRFSSRTPRSTSAVTRSVSLTLPVDTDTMTALSRGQMPGPEASITKVVSANKLQQIANFGTDLLGMAGAVSDPALAPVQAWFQQALLYAPGMRIAGGTDEILRNIIAERVLGLPADMRADRGMPFNQIPTRVR